MRFITSGRRLRGAYRLLTAALLVPTCVLGVAGIATLTGCSASHDDDGGIPANALVVTPSTATVVAGGTQTFSASGVYAATSGVTWRVQEGDSGGTITSAGVYTAPTTTGTYHVIATSVQYPTFSVTITVVVVASTTSPDVSISLAPTTATLNYGATQLFAATISNSTNTNVTWAVQEGSAGGTITSDGVYTAPSTTGTYHVIATSAADPTKTATATVTVQAPTVVSVAINPTSATLVTGANQTFAATVSNASNTNVTWSVQEGTSGGTITSAGVYTAPSTTGTYHVIATSAADSTKTATATVTVQTAPVTTGSGTVNVN